jgi:hypothetical protein
MYKNSHTDKLPLLLTEADTAMPLRGEYMMKPNSILYVY